MLNEVLKMGLDKNIDLILLNAIAKTKNDLRDNQPTTNLEVFTAKQVFTGCVCALVGEIESKKQLVMFSSGKISYIFLSDIRAISFEVTETNKFLLSSHEVDLLNLKDIKTSLELKRRMKEVLDESALDISFDFTKVDSDKSRSLLTKVIESFHQILKAKMEDELFKSAMIECKELDLTFEEEKSLSIERDQTKIIISFGESMKIDDLEKELEQKLERVL